MGVPVAHDHGEVPRKNGRRVARRTVSCVETLRTNLLLGQIFTLHDVLKVTGLEQERAERFLRWLASEEIIETRQDDVGNDFFYFIR